MPFDPSSLFDASHLVTFLAGTAAGAAGTYLADRMTDQRRRQEAKADEMDQLGKLQQHMPEFLDEIRADLASNPELAIREFVVLPNERVIFNHEHPRFEYYETDHPAAMNFVKLLAGAGFVQVVRSHSTPIYRLREHFVSWLRDGANPV